MVFSTADLADRFFNPEPEWAGRAYELLGRITCLWGRVDMRLRAWLDTDPHAPVVLSTKAMAKMLDQVEASMAKLDAPYAVELKALLNEARSLAKDRNVIQHAGILCIDGPAENFTLLMFSDRPRPDSVATGWHQIEYREQELSALAVRMGMLAEGLASLFGRYRANATSTLFELDPRGRAKQ